MKRDKNSHKNTLHKSLLGIIFESLPFDLFVIGEDGRYIMQNTTCRKHWGEVIGKRPEDVAPDKETLNVWQKNNKKAFSGKTVKGEVTFNIKGQENTFPDPNEVCSLNTWLQKIGVELVLVGCKGPRKSINIKNNGIKVIFCSACLTPNEMVSLYLKGII